MAVAPAAGILLAALLLLEPARWPGPLVAGAVAVGAVTAAHDLGAEISWSHARCRPSPPRRAAAILLRWYGGGRFRLARVQELVALVARRGHRRRTGRHARHPRSRPRTRPLLADLWRAAWQCALADGVGMVLVAAVVAHLHRTHRFDPPTRRSRRSRCPRRSRWWSSSALAFGRWDDPFAFAAVLLLGWAALDFGPRGVALSGTVMAGVAVWAAARATGPFTDVGDPTHTGLVLQAFLVVTFLAALALALALDERDAAEANRWAAAERFRRTFHDSPVAMAVATLDGRIVETNRALCELLGQPDHRLVGTTLRSLRADDTGEHELSRSAAAGQRHARPTRVTPRRRARRERVGGDHRDPPPQTRGPSRAHDRRAARRHRAQGTATPVPARAEDGVGRSARRRHRPRLQQRARDHARPGRAAAGRPPGPGVGARPHRLGAARHRSRRRAHRRPDGVQPPAGRRTGPVRSARAGARRPRAPAPGARRDRRRSSCGSRRHPRRSSPTRTASSRRSSTSR